MNGRLTPFSFHVNRPYIRVIRLFETLTMKIPPPPPPPKKKKKNQGYSQSERSHSQSSIQLICFLPILHQSDVMEWHLANKIYASVNLSIAGSANNFQLFCTKIIPRQVMTLWPSYVETKLNDTKLKSKTFLAVALIHIKLLRVAHVHVIIRKLTFG